MSLILPENVSVCIVSYNCATVIEACLNSIPEECPVLVIDNGSKDNGLEVARLARPNAVFIDYKKNIGFGSGHNQLLKLVKTPFSLLLNPDAALTPDTIPSLLKTAQQFPKASIVGGLHFHEDGDEEICFKPYESGLVEPKEVDMVSGALMLLRMEAFNGEFFDENIFLYYEDDDLCDQTRKNDWKVVIDPNARYAHVISHSTNCSLRGAWFRGFHTAKSHYYLKKKNGYLENVVGEDFASKCIRRKARHMLIRALKFDLSSAANLYGQICGYREARKN